MNPSSSLECCRHVSLHSTTLPSHIVERLKCLPLTGSERVEEEVSDAEVELAEVEEIASAQQRVFLVTLLRRHDGSHPRLIRVIVRVWKGSAQWWNLHQTSDCRRLAHAEVAGYRLARHLLQQQHDGRSTNNGVIIVPKVLCFSGDEEDTVHRKEHSPWAVFEYAARTDGDCRRQHSFVTQVMVKTRFEFGYEEPHLRHGRVPVALAIHYGMQLLDRIIFPLHFLFFSHPVPQQHHKLLHALSSSPNHNNNNNDDTKQPARRETRYGDMLHLYEQTVLQLKQQQPHHSIRTSLEERDNTTTPDPFPSGGEVIHLLEICVKTLRLEAEQDHPGLLSGVGIPPVLCHMDLQPQNMMFNHYHDITCTSSRSEEVPLITALLDWEDAKYADPRFEVLLICRKVLANSDQATMLWNCYNDAIQHHHPGVGSMGPIQPWFKLEAVHSILTILLQLQGCGQNSRSPWENKLDLWNKMKREFDRLSTLGWTFCTNIPPHPPMNGPIM